MNYKIIEKYMDQLPVYQYAFVPVEELEFLDRVRSLCKRECPRYGKSWSCPPAVGSLKHCKENCMQYSHALIFSTIEDITEDGDRKKLVRSKKEHERITSLIEGFMREQAFRCYALSSDVCTLCEKCNYPKKSCVHPEKMHPCIESHGIDLKKNLQDYNMDYYLGDQMVVWFSLIFLKEA